MSLLRTFMLLALVVWVGGIIFFGFVLAPTLFKLLTVNDAGNVVSRSLTVLHWMGIISAVVFLICSVLYSRIKLARAKVFSLTNVLMIVMLAFTLISQFGISPRMRALRAEMHSADQRAASDVAKAEFDRLHQWSTRLEGGVLVCGIIVVVLTARRFQ